MTAPTGYSRAQIALHWIVVALIAAQYLLNDAISDAWESLEDGGEAGFDPLVLAHVAAGALVLISAFWLLGLRARRGRPPAMESSKLLVVIAKITHISLYALMILMPVSGAVAWFGGVELAAEGHEFMKPILLALIALHVAGALYHQVILRDGTLARMLKSQS